MDSIAQARFIKRKACINCGSPDFIILSQGRYDTGAVADFIRRDPGGERVLPHLQQAEWAIARCPGCGQVFHKFTLDEEWNERRFSEWMDAESILEFEQRHAAGQPPAQRKFDAGVGYASHVLRIERLTKSLRPAGEAVRVLDFGCGWGGFLKMATAFGFDAVGVDRAMPRIEGAAVEVFPSLAAMGKRDPFHAITLFEVLEHLDEPAAMLKELAPYLITGGLLVLETPDCEGVTDIKSEYDYYKLHPLEHINAFTHATLTSIAERAGFERIVRGPAYVTAEHLRALKRGARHLLGRDASFTQLYFRRRG